ncbi:MAG: formylglycine-generating enzyme family protein [Phycisphaerales bacterium]|jgi:formylglycine-generating enzyme required for sulfatase activity|nr:formylglycine-generating enzyme family protein [Phycisphaerales bacterium]
MRHLPLLALTALPLAAQTRATTLIGPPALGGTCYVRHVLPAGTFGNIAGFLWSGPFAGALPVPLPGFTVSGLLRVDPTAFQLLGITLTNGVDLPTMPLAVPVTAALIGSQLDCQSFDLDATSTIRLAINDVTVTVIQGPDPALNLQSIPPGTFLMGSMLGNANEQPVHQVTLTYPFWMGKHEVTQGQFQALLGSNPSQFAGTPNAALRPVERVSWYAARQFCQALTAAEQAAGRVPTGYEYRLPTEAEWEYCCRAGTTTEWSTGASISMSQANINGALASPTWPTGQTAVVGSYPANAFGVHDLHGNVAEWCLDSFVAYTAAALVDPFFAGGWMPPIRGGTWPVYNGAASCRSAIRGSYGNGLAVPEVGFRYVLAPIRTP